MQEHISAHFRATQELYVQTGAHRMSPNYFDAILEEAGAFSLLGEVPLTVIGSDTTRRALHPRLGFYSPACGPARSAQQVVQSCKGIFGQVLLRYPFVNFLEFSSQKSDSPSLVEVLHLSKYLQALKPIVLVTMSIQVFKLFHDNALVYCLNTDNADFPRIWQAYPTSLEHVPEYVSIRQRSNSSAYIGMANLLANLFIG